MANYPYYEYKYGKKKMAYKRYSKKRRTRRKRKAPMMKVAHKNMLKGAGVFLALLVFKPAIPQGIASKIQTMLGGK